MNNSNFRCIYCLRNYPEIEPSLSHIIPEALGGQAPILELENAVCKVCNGEINRKVETPVKDSFQFLRYLLGIENERGEIPSFKAEAGIGGLKSEKTFHDDDTDKKQMWVFRNDKKIMFVPPEGELNNFIKSYKNKHPNKKLEIVPLDKQPVWSSCINFNVCCEETGLRLAAKIAFEFLCKKRGNEWVLDKDFDFIRNYIREGIRAENDIIVSIITNKEVLFAFSNIPVGNHCIIFTPTTDRAFVGIVGLFGLVYYKVILQKTYLLATAEQEMIIITPWKDEPYLPCIKGTYIPIQAKDTGHFVAPEQAMRNIWELIEESWRNFYNNFYNP